MEITARDLDLARWRCGYKFKIPEQHIDDFLQEAALCYLQQKEQLTNNHNFAVGNWIAKVAYFRFMDWKNKLSTRKTVQMPVKTQAGEDETPLDFPAPEKEERNLDEVKARVQHLIQNANTPSQKAALESILRFGGVRAASIAERKTTKVFYFHLKKLRTHLGETL